MNLLWPVSDRATALWPVSDRAPPDRRSPDHPAIIDIPNQTTSAKSPAELKSISANRFDAARDQCDDATPSRQAALTPIRQDSRQAGPLPEGEGAEAACGRRVTQSHRPRIFHPSSFRLYPFLPMLIRVGHSPDPDDAFMFHALANGKIDTGRTSFAHELVDIETLNRRAFPASWN